MEKINPLISQKFLEAIKNQKIIIGVIIIAVIVVFIGWQMYEDKQGNSGSIKIGVAIAGTGEASEWGQGEFRVIQMYIDDLNARGGVNGKQINLVVEDTKSTGVGTVDAVMKLIKVDKVPVIIGPTWGDSFQGGYPIAEDSKTVLLTPSAALETVEDKEKFTYLFSTWWPQLTEVQALQNFMLSHGIKNIFIVNDHDAFNTKVSDIFENAAKEKNLNIIGREQIPIGQNDFRTIIIKAKQLKPDAIFVEMQSVSNIGPFMKQAKELGLSARVFSTSAGQNEDAVKKFKEAMESFTYSFIKTPSGAVYDNFVKEYQAKYKQLPSGPSVLNTYNAIVALTEVLKSGAQTGTEIRDALYKVKVSGIGVPEVSFNSLGQINEADFEIRMVRDGQFITVND
ncbi:MAG: ABC transporter substrate-binding protein [Spirochaetia bacterium]|nr:MAG: ABC transporter substrate-binding protein [Spirochaetia bacterium]